MAHPLISYTLNANGQSTGMIDVDYTETAIGLIITGTITATLQRSLDEGVNWVTVSTHTASTIVNVAGPGEYRVSSSAVTGGTCVVQILRARAR
jgi:hypothetical protein